jgi:predicted nucleic acid-binding protein
LLYDTSVLIGYLRRNNPRATLYVDVVRNGTVSACCSVVTEAELFTGIRNRRERAEVESILDEFQIIPMTSSIARLAGSLLRGNDENQIKAHFGDALIGTSAIDAGETILTTDGRSQRVFGSQVSYLVHA